MNSPRSKSGSRSREEHGEPVLLERARTIQEKTLGADHVELAYTLVALANIALVEQHFDEAVPLAERAVHLRENGGAPVELVGEARFVLAQALWDAPAGQRDRKRAMQLAEQARDAHREAGDVKQVNLAAVETWLASHAARGAATGK